LLELTVHNEGRQRSQGQARVIRIAIDGRNVFSTDDDQDRNASSMDCF
jgi:hypothetical protein